MPLGRAGDLKTQAVFRGLQVHVWVLHAPNSGNYYTPSGFQNPRISLGGYLHVKNGAMNWF